LLQLSTQQTPIANPGTERHRPRMVEAEGANNTRSELIEHLRAFGGSVSIEDWTVPNGWAPEGLSIVTMEPSKQYPWWNFATVGCWQAQKDCHYRTEFILSATEKRAEHVELLKMAAHLHLDPAYSVSVGKVLNIGVPWVDGSACTSLLASLPYPFGPYFEWPDVKPCTRFLWLLPITGKEAALAERESVESLEHLFETAGVAFADPYRASVVA
jgi:hypothetical protein